MPADRPSWTLSVTLGFLALAGLVSPSSVLSQAAAAPTQAAQGARGWVGMSLEIPVSPSGRFETVLVKDVRQGSPAWKAGVRAGDTLLSIDGHGADENFGGVTQTLQAGDSVTLTVERDGRRRQFKMVATPRPDDVPDRASLSVSLGSDSMADLMFRAMDSLRLRLIQGRDGFLGVVTLPGPDDVPVSGNIPAPGRILVRGSGGNPTGVFGPPVGDSVTVELLPEVTPPFSFFVFRGDRSDSLQSEMDRLNMQIRELRARQAERLRQLTARSPAGQGRVDANDPELQRLAGALDSAGRRAADLRSAMERAAREQAGSVYVAGGNGTMPAGREQVAFRPLAPYLLGQDRVAGAEVVNLRPALAAYFEVEGGVLVVDVPAGTPAALARVRPGDVLTHVDGIPIHSIEELRIGLAKAGADPRTLTLVRRGRTLIVHLPR